MDIGQGATGDERHPLERAVRAAIDQSRDVARDLQRSVDTAIALLDDALGRARAGAGVTPETDALLASIADAVAHARDAAADLFARQLDRLSNIHFTLFGRTGVGKSSLIEALTRGNAKTVSTGESDFTTSVRSVFWQACLFHDTPGINGWGRTERREVLEEQARGEVETADLVVLCFDTQSQQCGEFKKIAEWVLRYRKPALAVLNVRNHRWRRPALLPHRAQRVQCQQAVREHAANIRAELASLGLPDAPVVAISAKTAVFARAKEPYAGPWQKEFRDRRAKHGTDTLLAESNLAVLEQVLITALEQEAAALRLGMLCAETDAILARLKETIGNARQNVENLVKTLDRAIEDVLAVLGLPPPGSPARESLRHETTGEDLLARAETARGRPFEAPLRGRAERFVSGKLEAALGALRHRSLAKAEQVISHAFETKTDIDGAAFVSQVFEQAETQAVANRLDEDIIAFVREEIGIVVDSARLDLQVAAAEAPEIPGSTGQTKEWAGIAIQGVVLVATAASWFVGGPLARVVTGFLEES
ncbi:MAG: 50S ribosome-binding GTPase [Elioraea sp.]|nr:50S ribosome-binding GTPase [Elioraea sp.]